MKRFLLSVAGAVAMALALPQQASAADTVTFKCNDPAGIFVQQGSNVLADFTTTEFTLETGVAYPLYFTPTSTWTVNTAVVNIYAKPGYTLESVTVDGTAKTILHNGSIYPPGASYSDAITGLDKCNLTMFSNIAGKTVDIVVKKASTTATFTLDIESGADQYTAKFDPSGRELTLSNGSNEIEYNPATENTLVLKAQSNPIYALTTLTVDDKTVNASVSGFYVPLTDGCTIKMNVEEVQIQEYEITVDGKLEAVQNFMVGYTAVVPVDGKFKAPQGEPVRVNFNDTYYDFTIQLNDGAVEPVSDLSYRFTPTENTKITIGAKDPVVINVKIDVSDPAAFTIRKMNANGEIINVTAGVNNVEMLSTKNTIYWSLNPGYGVDTTVPLCEGKTFTQIQNDQADEPRFGSPFVLTKLENGTTIKLVATTYEFDKTLVMYMHPSTYDRTPILAFNVADYYELPADRKSTVPFVDGYQVVTFCQPMASGNTAIRGFINTDGVIFLNNEQIEQTEPEPGVFGPWATTVPNNGDVYKVYPGVTEVTKSQLAIETADNVKASTTITYDVIKSVDTSALYSAEVLPGTVFNITGDTDLRVSVNGEYIEPTAEPATQADEVAPQGRKFTITTQEGTDYVIEITDANDIPTGIDGIETAPEAVEYFNMQGIRVAEPVKGGLYIRVKGSNASKVIIK